MNRTINATLYILIFAIACIIFGQLLAGCSVIEKLKHKHTESVDSTTRTKTEKIETVQKDLQVVGGVTVRFDTGCKNTFAYNPHTGQIEASGGVAGVSVAHEKKEAVKEAKSDRNESEGTYRKDVVEINKQTTTKPKWWVKWLYVAIGAAGMWIVCNWKKVLGWIMPIKKFYPF